MSEWTYVRGCLELSSSPFEINKKFNQVEPKRKDFDSDEEYEKAIDKYRVALHKAIYLPYPEEQFKLGSPIIRNGGKNEKGHITFDGTCIYSLPRAKKYIEEAFKLFPQGELGFRYWLDQKSDDGRSSMSGFIHPCLFKYYHDAVDKMYKGFSSRWCSKWNFKDLNKYIGIDEDCSYENIAAIFCGIKTSLRSATAEEVKESLVKFIKYLNDHEISIDDGYLEWHDSYTLWSNFRYAFRSGTWLGEYSIMKLDIRTNKIIWKLSHTHPKVKGTKKTDFDKFINIEECFVDKENSERTLDELLKDVAVNSTMADKVRYLIKSGIVDKDTLEVREHYKGVFELPNALVNAYLQEVNQNGK